MNQCRIFLLIQLVALWPLWGWYVMRMADSSDEPWGLLALITALIFLFHNKNHRIKPEKPHLTLPAILMVVYAALFHLSPPLLRAIIGVTSIACMISACQFGTPIHWGVWGLFLMSLPIISSLQFYCGFPLRVIVGDIAALLLQLAGLPVVRDGTILNWCGNLIRIDAPCSGVRMLWAGFYLTFTLACFFKLTSAKTLTVALFTLSVIIFGNVLRATALFYIEAGIVSVPSWTHTLCGLIIFVLACFIILFITQKVKEVTLCDP
ncbi:MAG: archaeosortase/exosortase family protein [bacterium]